MTEVENITPYGLQGDDRAKNEQVRDMFDSIAPAYDLMNRMMTFGIDRRWRRRCVDTVARSHPDRILDLATGTGDLAVELAEKMPHALVTGADLSEGMIHIGQEKVAVKGLKTRVTFIVADALSLPFDDNAFDAVTIAFGVRNFENLDKGYAEMLRVLRPGGRLMVLELTPPSSRLVKPFYKLYTRRIIPLVGRLVSKDTRAYSYLPESVAAVPARDDMTRIMASVGFADCRWDSLTFGVATIYTAVKPTS